jgi:Immunoglobulin I-set domain
MPLVFFLNFCSKSFFKIFVFKIPVLPKLSPFSVGEPLFLHDFYQIYCSVVHGDSPFTFHWLFQNESIETVYDIKVENSKRRSILSIDSVNGKHAGNYTCKVLNSAGFSTITTTLVVKGWSKTHTFLVFSLFRFFSSPPSSAITSVAKAGALLRSRRTPSYGRLLPAGLLHNPRRQSFQIRVAFQEQID